MINWLDECFKSGGQGYASLQLMLKDGNKFSMNTFVDKKYEGEYTTIEEYVEVINKSDIKNIEFLISSSKIDHVHLMGLLSIFTLLNNNLKDRMLNYIKNEFHLPRGEMIGATYSIRYPNSRDNTKDLIFHLTLNKKITFNNLKYEMDKGAKRDILFGKIYNRHCSVGGAFYVLKWWKKMGVELKFPNDDYTKSYREKYKI